MDHLALTGAQKTHLRGLGQTLRPSLQIGKAGLTPASLIELQKLFAAHELIKVRFVGSDRELRAERARQIADEGHCVHVGSVGANALFYRQQPDPERRQIQL